MLAGENLPGIVAQGTTRPRVSCALPDTPALLSSCEPAQSLGVNGLSQGLTAKSYDPEGLIKSYATESKGNESVACIDLPLMPLNINCDSPYSVSDLFNLTPRDDETIQSLFHRLRGPDTLIRDRDRIALRDYLVMLHTPLVEHCARSLAITGEPIEDLVQEGCIGLIKAVDRFNPQQGVRFSTYAHHLISGEIRHYLRDLGKLIHEPGWHSELRQRVSRTHEHLTHKLSRPPQVEELAEALHLQVDAVREVLKKQQALTVESLDMGTETEGGEDNGGSSWSGGWHEGLNHFAAPLETLIDNRLLLDAALPQLTNLEQYAVKLFFYEELTKTEIARCLGISINYAAYLIKRGLKHLRQVIEATDPMAAATPGALKVRRVSTSRLKTIVNDMAENSMAENGLSQHGLRMQTAKAKGKRRSATQDTEQSVRVRRNRRFKDTSGPLERRRKAKQEEQMEVPTAYRHDVGAYPHFVHWLDEEVRRATDAGSSLPAAPALCLVWHQVRRGVKTVTRLDAAKATEAVGAAQAMARRCCPCVDIIMRPPHGPNSGLHLFSSLPEAQNKSEDILIITPLR